VLAGVLSGMLVDRLNRRVFMLSCDALSAALYASTPLFLNVGLTSRGPPPFPGKHARCG
jgi:hypothetical protein